MRKENTLENDIEVLDRILELKALSIPDVDRDGILYTARPLRPILPMVPIAVEVHTLSGLVDLINALGLAEVFVQVVSPGKVTVSATNADLAEQRAELVKCTTIHDTQPFAFGSFYNPEEFAIALQSKFVEDVGDLTGLLRLASNVRQEAVTINDDDGFSQKISASAGVHLKKEITSKPRLMLAPYRTFPEVEQPVSQFLFRAKGGSPTELPKLALFEADGGKWRVDATENIARFLRVLLPDTKLFIVS